MAEYIHPARRARELESEILTLRGQLEADSLPLEQKKALSTLIVGKCNQLLELCHQIQGTGPFVRDSDD